MDNREIAAELLARSNDVLTRDPPRRLKIVCVRGQSPGALAFVLRLRC